jgi:hypothetical protein
VVLGVPIEVFNSEAFRKEFKDALILVVGRNLSASNIHFLCAEKASTSSESSARRLESRYQLTRDATVEAVGPQSAPKGHALRDPSHEEMNAQFQDGRSGRVLEEISALKVLYSITLFSTSEAETEAEQSAGGTEATESAQRVRQSLSTGNFTAIFQALVNQDAVADSVALASADFTSDATVRLYTDVMVVDIVEGSGAGEGGSGDKMTTIIVSAAAISALLLVFVVCYRRNGAKKKLGAVFIAPEQDAMTPGRTSLQMRDGPTGRYDILDSRSIPASIAESSPNEPRMKPPSDSLDTDSVSRKARELPSAWTSNEVPMTSYPQGDNQSGSQRRSEWSEELLGPGMSQRAGRKLVPIPEMESMQNTTNFAMMDGDGALSGVFDAEEEQLTDIPSEAGRDDYSPVDALRCRTQWLDASGDADIDGHGGAEAGAGAGAGAGANVPAERGSQRNSQQGECGGGGTEALGPKKRLAASTQKQISRLRMHPNEIPRKPRRLHSHKINSDTGVPSLKEDVPVIPEWNSQYDSSKGMSRHALSVQDISGQQNPTVAACHHEHHE